MQRQLMSEVHREALELGELLIKSQWFVECVKVDLGKVAAKELKRLQVSKRLRGARKQ